MAMKCPTCGLAPMRTETRYGPRYACCGLWAWGESPLVDSATHNARKAAHAAFDALWRGGGMSRSEAYRRLSKTMGLPSKDCHIKLMDAEQARRVVDLVPLLAKEEAWLSA